jgi:mannosyltransferase OCH1-like enzyme
MQIPQAMFETPWQDWPYTQSQRVPYRLWQTYKTIKPPDEALEAYWSWRELNPGMPAVLHDDAAADACVQLLFGAEFHAAYTALPMVVMRTDIWRYAMLYAFGGIYCDVDVAAVHALEHWLPPKPDCVDWPPNNDSSVSPTWKDCNLITGLEDEAAFNQWVRVSMLQ